MPFNTYVLTDISLYAKYIWKIHNNRTEHKILNFRRNNIWLVCHAAFVLGNLLRYFANGWDSGRASTQDSSLILLRSTSNIFWFGFFLSLDRAHCCFVGFGLTMRYPVSGHKGVVAVDMHLFSRDFVSFIILGTIPQDRRQWWANRWEHHPSIAFPCNKLEPLYQAWFHDVAQG